MLVGLISDGAANAGLSNGLGLGLLIGPAFSVLTALALMAAGRRMRLASPFPPRT